MFNKGFKRYEFTCKCGCGFDTVDAELLYILEILKKELGGIIKNNSACRCVKYNEIIQKLKNPNYVPFSSRSQHLYSKAADIVISGLDPSVVYDYLVLRFPGKYGIGKYKTFTHIDVRDKMARW